MVQEELFQQHQLVFYVYGVFEKNINKMINKIINLKNILMKTDVKDEIENEVTNIVNNQPNEEAQTIISQNYSFVKTLGEGTFGKVKLGKHIPSGEEVAIKILEKDKLRSHYKTKINREINFMKNLYHRNIITLFDIVETSTSYYIIMEYAKNGDLFSYIVQNKKLTEAVAKKYFIQILIAIEYIHKERIVHRDLKPENILLDNNYQTIKIIDFGLSNHYNVGEYLSTPCGSLGYAAPEMISGKKYLGVLSDVWALGIILFAMVCGYLPFEGDNKTIYNHVIEGKYTVPEFLSPGCKDLIKKILVVNPKKRIGLEMIHEHCFIKDEYEEYYTKEIIKNALQKEKNLGVYCTEIEDQVISQTLDLVNSGNSKPITVDDLITMLKNNQINSITADYKIFLNIYQKKIVKLGETSLRKKTEDSQCETRPSSICQIETTVLVNKIKNDPPKIRNIKNNIGQKNLLSSVYLNNINTTHDGEQRGQKKKEGNNTVTEIKAKVISPPKKPMSNINHFRNKKMSLTKPTISTRGIESKQKFKRTEVKSPKDDNTRKIKTISPISHLNKSTEHQRTNSKAKGNSKFIPSQTITLTESRRLNYTKRLAESFVSPANVKKEKKIKTLQLHKRAISITSSFSPTKPSRKPNTECRTIGGKTTTRFSKKFMSINSRNQTAMVGTPTTPTMKISCGKEQPSCSSKQAERFHSFLKSPVKKDFALCSTNSSLESIKEKIKKIAEKEKYILNIKSIYHYSCNKKTEKSDNIVLIDVINTSNKKNVIKLSHYFGDETCTKQMIKVIFIEISF